METSKSEQNPFNKKSSSSSIQTSSPEEIMCSKENSFEENDLYLKIEDDNINQKLKNNIIIQNSLTEKKNNIPKISLIKHKNLSSPAVPKIPFLKRKSCPTPIILGRISNKLKNKKLNFDDDNYHSDGEKTNSDEESEDSDSSEDEGILKARRLYSCAIEKIDENFYFSENDMIYDNNKKLKIKILRKEMENIKKAFLKNIKINYKEMDNVTKNIFLKLKNKILNIKEVMNKKNNDKLKEDENMKKDKPILNYLENNSSNGLKFEF